MLHRTLGGASNKIMSILYELMIYLYGGKLLIIRLIVNFHPGASFSQGGLNHCQRILKNDQGYKNRNFAMAEPKKNLTWWLVESKLKNSANPSSGLSVSDYRTEKVKQDYKNS